MRHSDTRKKEGGVTPPLRKAFEFPAAAPHGARSFFSARLSADEFMGLPFTLILLGLSSSP